MRRLREAKLKEKQDALEKEQREMEQLKEYNKKQIERRMRPRTKADFDILHEVNSRSIYLTAHTHARAYSLQLSACWLHFFHLNCTELYECRVGIKRMEGIRNPPSEGVGRK